MNINQLFLVALLSVAGCSGGGDSGHPPVVIDGGYHPSGFPFDPSTVTSLPNQIRAVIQKWSDENPGKLVLPAGESIATMEINALSALFNDAWVLENPQPAAQ